MDPDIDEQAELSGEAQKFSEFRNKKLAEDLDLYELTSGHFSEVSIVAAGQVIMGGNDHDA